MRFACFCSTTQSYSELKKRSTPAVTTDETKTLEGSLRETNGGELREAKTMTVNKRINEYGRNHGEAIFLAKAAG